MYHNRRKNIIDFSGSLECGLEDDIWKSLSEGFKATAGVVGKPDKTDENRLPELMNVSEPTDVHDDTEQNKYRIENLFSKITDRVNKHILPLLEEMDKIVAYGDAQTKATNEHNEKLKKDLFRKGVITELKVLATRLPDGHPIRMRIESI